MFVLSGLELFGRSGVAPTAPSDLSYSCPTSESNCPSIGIAMPRSTRPGRSVDKSRSSVGRPCWAAPTSVPVPAPHQPDAQARPGRDAGLACASGWCGCMNNAGQAAGRRAESDSASQLQPRGHHRLPTAQGRGILLVLDRFTFNSFADHLAHSLANLGQRDAGFPERFCDLRNDIAGSVVHRDPIADRLGFWKDRCPASFGKRLPGGCDLRDRASRFGGWHSFTNTAGKLDSAQFERKQIVALTDSKAKWNFKRQEKNCVHCVPFSSPKKRGANIASRSSPKDNGSWLVPGTFTPNLIRRMDQIGRAHV